MLYDAQTMTARRDLTAGPSYVLRRALLLVAVVCACRTAAGRSRKRPCSDNGQPGSAAAPGRRGTRIPGPAPRRRHVLSLRVEIPDRAGRRERVSSSIPARRRLTSRPAEKSKSKGSRQLESPPRSSSPRRDGSRQPESSRRRDASSITELSSGEYRHRRVEARGHRPFRETRERWALDIECRDGRRNVPGARQRRHGRCARSIGFVDSTGQDSWRRPYDVQQPWRSDPPSGPRLRAHRNRWSTAPGPSSTPSASAHAGQALVLRTISDIRRLSAG